MRLYFNFITLLILGFVACNQPYVIKPKGYQKVILPQKQYQAFSSPEHPYTFDYPIYAVVDKDVSYLGSNKAKYGWLNIKYPQFGATLFVSYNKIAQIQSMDTLVRDAYKFANNHNSKASFIEDSSYEVNKNVKGVFFHIGGDVATAYQFFATDSSRHFLRAALYFDTTPNEDSLSVVNHFLYQDLQQMVRSLRWK